MLFYQIHVKGKALGETAYPSFEQAAAEWAAYGRDGQVVLVQGNQIKHVYPAAEAEEAARRFTNLL